MTKLCQFNVHAPIFGIWPILCQLMVILAKLLDTDFIFVLQSIYINFYIQTNFKVNQTQLGHSIPKNTQK